MFLLVSMTGCIAAAPLVIRAMKGKKHSTATVLINEDADKIYAIAIEAIKKRGYTQIVKQDPAKRYIEGDRNGKHATFQAIPEGKQTRAILTMEKDKDKKEEQNLALDSAVQALMEVCQELGLECQLQES
jgi:ADP-ribosylglycohydrolase